MLNDSVRAEFWKEFILLRSGYPSLDRLEAHLSGAEFSKFCECGCNSFAVTVRPDVASLVPGNGRSGSIYEADFLLSDQRTLEIILFADEVGNLSYIEVDCCGNSYPVPDNIEADTKPFLTTISKGILD